MSKVFTPTVDADAAYGEGDWRPLLGARPRELEYKLYMIGKQSIEHKLRGFMMPSYDWTMSLDDKAFAASIGACWSNTADKRLPRHFAPNAFALPLLVYPYLGEKKEHWFSPANRRNMIGGDAISADDAADAFDDLNRWIRRNKAFDDAKKDFFLKAPSMREDALVPGRSLRFFSLNKCIDKENKWHRAVTGMTPTAYSYVLEQLRWAHRSEDGPARDVNWPQYMLGDPTDPTAAIEWHVDKIQLDAKDTHDTNVIVFTERTEFLDANQKTHKITEDDLLGRFQLPDPNNWLIPTYEEQVDYMMNHFDAAITADMIRAACSARYRGTIPSARPEHVRLSSASASKERSPDDTDDHSSRRGSRTSRETSQDEGDPMAAVTGGRAASRVAPTNSAPPMPERKSAPAPAPAPAKAAAPAPGTTYWTGTTGAKPVKKTVEELQVMVDSGTAEGVKVQVAPNQWALLLDSGLVSRPEVIEEDAPPSVPDDDAPPSVPDDAPAADGQVRLTRDGMKARFFPDATSFNRLAPDKKQLAESLVDRALKATDGGLKSELPDDVVADLMHLSDLMQPA